MIIFSFLLFLLLFVCIGLASVTKSKQQTEDYLIASRSIPPWLVALSAVATANSGFMFIAQIGYTYNVGLASFWLLFGFVVGDFIISLFVHQPVRVASERCNAHTFGGLVSGWNGQRFEYLRKISGIVSLIFMGTYAAAQLKAGSKALHVLFNWDIHVGAAIGACIVLLYCLAGGIRASIWTDAAQSVVMIIAMGVLVLSGVAEMGGVDKTYEALKNVGPHYLELFPDSLTFGPIPFIIGWLFGGAGIIGQPHIMIRFLALDDPKAFWKVRCYYYTWYTSFSLLAIAVGMIARLLLALPENFDPELALPQLALQLLPDILVGLVLAGLFAATMSTADSLVLSCSASITRDFIPKLRESYFAAKIATASVTCVAFIIALFGSDSVFELVMIAWSSLAAAFGPLLIVYSLGGKPSEKVAITMSLVGICGVLIWRHYGFQSGIYEAMPGMLIGLFVFGVHSCVRRVVKAS